jgi:hypothetical protein
VLASPGRAGALARNPAIGIRPHGFGQARAVIELIEERVARGGGCDLFAGCAAGDTAMAVVLEVSGRRRAR